MSPFQGWRDNSVLHKATLPKKWQEHCAGLPESGMGYQEVKCRVKKEGKETVVSAIVLNGSIMESVEDIRLDDIISISLA